VVGQAQSGFGKLALEIYRSSGFVWLAVPSMNSGSEPVKGRMAIFSHDLRLSGEYSFTLNREESKEIADGHR
jgi:hypothetical protein